MTNRAYLTVQGLTTVSRVHKTRERLVFILGLLTAEECNAAPATDIQKARRKTGKSKSVQPAPCLVVKQAAKSLATSERVVHSLVHRLRNQFTIDVTYRFAKRGYCIEDEAERREASRIAYGLLKLMQRSSLKNDHRGGHAAQPLGNARDPDDKQRLQVRPPASKPRKSRSSVGQVPLFDSKARRPKAATGAASKAPIDRHQPRAQQ